MKVKNKILLTVISSLFTCVTLYAQISENNQIQTKLDSIMAETFNNIAPNTDFLFNKGFYDPETFQSYLLDYFNQDYAYTITKPRTWKYIYGAIGRSIHNNYPELLPLESLTSNHASTDVLIGIINIEGKYINPYIIEDYYNEAKGSLDPNIPQNTVNLFVASNLTATIYSRTVTFKIDPNLYISNKIDTPTIEIDFGDGLGYQLFNFNTVASRTINYTSNGEKNIKIKATSNGKVKISYSTLNVKHINFKTSSPVKRSSSIKHNQNCASGAVFQMANSCDDIFDKPIIIVEGFDSGEGNRSSTADLLQRYEDSGFSEVVRNAGYDLVAVQFTRNNSRIEENSCALAEVINEINDLKTGNFENIILGESMGGLISRIALAEMEANSIDHQVGLYISFDSPHKGANIPLGIQKLPQSIIDTQIFQVLDLENLFTFFETPNIDILGSGLSAYTGVDNLVDLVNAQKSPAAKQMLIRHTEYGLINPEHQRFRNFLETTGYPNKSRNIALINGGSNGVGQRRSDNELMTNTLDQRYIDKKEGCRACGVKANFDVWVSPVNHNNHKVSDLEIRTCLLFTCVKTTDKEYRADFDNKPWDISPGGFIEHEQGNSLNDSFSFVPTVSAIDLDQSIIDGNNGLYYFARNDDNPLRDKDQIVQLDLTPFDDIYFGFNNTEHIAIINRLFNRIITREVMFDELFLQNKIIESGWVRDFEAGDFILIGNDVNPWENNVFSFNNKEIEDGNVIVESGAELNLRANNRITIQPGFQARAGSVFRAGIQPTNPVCIDNGRTAAASPSKTEKTTTKMMPIPAISFVKNETEYTFYNSNYSSNDEVSYQWKLTGENQEYESSNRLMAITGLPYGQYTLKSTINGTYTNTKVIQIIPETSKLNNSAVKESVTNVVNNPLLIYPNPTSENLSIVFEKAKPNLTVVLKIYNMYGALLYEKTTNQTDQTLDVKHMASGTYVLTIQSADINASKKLVISNK